MMRHPRVLSVAIVALAASTACSKKSEPAPAPSPVANEDSAARARADSLAREKARADSIARAQAEADRMKGAQAAVAAAAATLAAPIYFELDSDALSDASRSSLDAKVAVMNASQAVKIRVAGHADERGSDEYNLALGQRRASAAKRYLADHGVGDARIDLISYGEERPIDTGHDESAWSKNRRDEFEVTAGADQVVAPPTP